LRGVVAIGRCSINRGPPTTGIRTMPLVATPGQASRRLGRESRVTVKPLIDDGEQTLEAGDVDDSQQPVRSMLRHLDIIDARSTGQCHGGPLTLMRESAPFKTHSDWPATNSLE
jgi:hypothetical protein